MNILFFSRLFYPHIGGVEIHTLEIAKRLVKNGHKVTVITENYGLESTDEIQGIKIFRIDVGKNNKSKKFRVWKWIYNHRSLLKRSDIIHCHDIFFWYLPFRFLYPLKPVFITFHGYEMDFPPKLKSIIIRKIGEVLSWGNISVGAYLKKWYKTRPNFIIYGGINRITTEEKFGFEKKIKAEKRIRIGFLGRIEKDTGIPIYLASLKKLRETKFTFSFYAIGDGSLRQKTEEYGKVSGFITNTEKELKKVDIVFASSYLSTLEAFNNRKYVLSVYDNSLKEDILRMTPWTNWITITNSPEKVFETLKGIVKNPGNYANDIEAAYKWVQMQTWTEIYNIYLKLWEI